MIPPPLAWLDGFVFSIIGAIGAKVSYTISITVNPLVYRIRFNFHETVSGKNIVLIWNLFQMYAARNDCIPQGKAGDKRTELVAEVAIKRRLGPTRNQHPLE